MGYSVKPVKSKHRSWRLLIEKNVETGKRRVRKYGSIPTDKLGLHGFRSDMSYDEARQKAAVLNRSNEEIRHAERKAAITKRMQKERDALSVFVPDEGDFTLWCAEEHRIELTGKLESHWKCAKTALAALALKPTEFYDKRRNVYRWFQGEQYSLAYLKKVLRFLNLYGEYISHRYKTYFKAVPYPEGRDKQDINNTYRKKEGSGKKRSKPLTPELLTSAQSKLSEAQYNWLYLSLWLGLRPEEVDNLGTDFCRVEADTNGVTVVAVYQTKLERTVDEDKRWKYIPLLYPAQSRIPALIESGKFSRPLCKTVRKHIGPDYTLYAGRKGFEPLMTGLGQPFQFVSMMLGHQKIEMTYQNYTDRTKARYIMPKKAS